MTRIAIQATPAAAVLIAAAEVSGVARWDEEDIAVAVTTAVAGTCIRLYFLKASKRQESKSRQRRRD